MRRLVPVDRQIQKEQGAQGGMSPEPSTASIFKASLSKKPRKQPRARMLLEGKGAWGTSRAAALDR